MNTRAGYVPAHWFSSLIFWVLGVFFQRRHRSVIHTYSNPRRVVVYKAGEIGDAVFVLPALRAIKKHYPHCRLEVIVYEKTKVLFEGDPTLAAVHSFPLAELKNYRYFLTGNMLKDVRHLWKLFSGTDLMISLNRLETVSGTLKYAVLAALINPSRVVGLNTRGRGFFLTDKVFDDGYLVEHEVQTYYRVLQYLNITEIGESSIYLDDRDRVRVKEFLHPIGQNQLVIGIHPGGGSDPKKEKWSGKRWPAASYRALIEHLMSRTNIKIALIGGRDESALVEQIISGLEGPEILNLAGRLNLKEVAALAERCVLFIGNDTGPMHIAAAMNIATATIFGYSDFRGYAPYGTAGVHHIIRQAYACSPCIYWFHRRTCRGNPCISTLSVATVREKIDSMLKELCA